MVICLNRKLSRELLPRNDVRMSQKQTKILAKVKENEESIESERYNAKDPIVEIKKTDTQEDVIIKVLTSERTQARLKFENELMNTAEDKAQKYFSSGIRALGSWQFKKSINEFDEGANLTKDLAYQQRINLFKQIHKLIQGMIHTSPDFLLKSKGVLFEEIAQSLTMYDKLPAAEKDHYQKSIDSLNLIAQLMGEGDLKLRSQQLEVKCSISLLNHEYLASYIWLYKIYLLNKEEFDKLAGKNEILLKALKDLKTYLEYETGLNEELEEAPRIASAYDLHMIFIDHLSEIFDVHFIEDTADNFAIKQYQPIS